MNDAQLRAILGAARTIAILGAKDSPGQPVDRVGRYLLTAGYSVLPVHPKRRTVWGIPAYAALDAVPGPVDVVDVFRAPEHCLAHARETLLLLPRPRLFWMQLGIANAPASALLAGQGISVVENACLMVEHARIFGRECID